MATSVNFGTEQYFGFDPRTIPGCQIWLDAADSRTITGNPVTTWADKSGNGRNATSPTGPTVSTYNGLPVLAFNGTTQYLTSTSTTIPANAHTLIAVHVPANINGNYQGNTSVFRFQINGSGGKYIAFPSQYTTIPRGYITSADSTGTLSYINSTLVENSVISRLNLIVANISSGNQRIFKDGVQQSSNNRTLTSGTSDYLTIGTSIGTNNEYYQGNIAEMLIFDRALTTSEQQQIEGYLGWKWGISFVPLSAVPISSPLSISGCQLWLDAADSSTITFSSGSNVSRWNDKSGNGLNFSRTSGTPTYTANTLTIPSGAIMTSSSSISVTTNTVLYVVSQLSSISGSGIDMLIAFSSIRSGDFSIRFNSSGLYGTLANAGNTGDFANARYYVNGVLNPSSVTYSTFTSSNIISGQSTTSGTTAITISSSFSSRFFIGNVYEILMYSSVPTESQRQQVEGYLATKWGLSSLLSINHPFTLYYSPYWLPVGHPFRMNPTTMRNFQPLDVSGGAPEFWFDAADTSTITTSPSFIWSNKGTATGSNITVAGISTASPSSGTVTQNGLNLVSLPNGAQLIFTGAFPNAARTRFIVTKPTTSSETSFLFQNRSASSGNDYLGINAGTSLVEIARVLL